MIPLTVRSHYSLMWGTASPKKICRTAKALGYNRLALTDTDNLYGLWPFLDACKQENITPIVGAELTDLKSHSRAICLVKNSEGYRNLGRRITRRHQDRAFDLKTDLCAYADGLMVLTQDPQLLLKWHESDVAVVAAVPRKPGGNAFKLRQTSRHIGVPLVATPGSFFLNPHGVKIHYMLRAIEKNTSLTRLLPKDTAPADAWLAPASTYADRFHMWPEAISSTQAIAEQLMFTGPRHGLVLPPWPDENIPPAALLRNAAYKGARRRYGHDLSETVVDRLEHELKIIEKMAFSTYFLVVQDIVSKSPRICGRGSGAASLVAYALGITNVCPIKHNLYFERFLNPGRSDPPDIDVDFAWDERDDILNAVLSQYRGHAAMVCNHVAFQPKMAIREVAKVFGLTDGEISRVSKRLPWFWRATEGKEDLLAHLKQLPELRALDFPHPWPRIIHIAQQLIGVPRYISVHSGGMVITPNPIDEYVPIEIAPKGVPIIPWEKDGTEESGLVKIDLLGNRSLGVIRDTIANLAENSITFDESAWNPEDDAATQANVAAGNTMGCFYIESPAMQLLQQKAKVGDFEHLVIHSSIIRPAANEFIREYIRRLHGGAWEPIHPLLTDILDETFGIMVYQEDVSKTAVALAGFSHADADGLRKIMSKKDKIRKLMDYKARFVAGARQRGVSKEQIQAVWNMMMSFSGYSFCKPHSASYARVSFQAAYLKTHFPAQFLAAVISNQGGFYSTFAYVSEARRMGLKICLPDINKSEIRWKGRNNSILVGLLSLKHIGPKLQKKIVLCREKRLFISLADFLERVRPGAPEAGSLIDAGAFDTLHPDRNRSAFKWELVCRQKSGSSRARTVSLFDKNPQIEKPAFPPECATVRLQREYAALGFLCDQHPMSLYADRLKGKKIRKAKDLPGFIGKQVRVAGLLITGKVVHTKHGDPMEFLTFEDETGRMETTFFPKAYHRFCSILDKTRPFILHGKVESDFGAHTLTVNRVEAVSKFDPPLKKTFFEI